MPQDIAAISETPERKNLSKLNALYRTDFESFMRKSFTIINPGQKLGDDPYLAYLCYVAEQVADGHNLRQVVNLPPAHLKTFLFSISMVAWILSRDPSKRIMVVTNAQPLAEQITYSIREIMRSSWFKDLSNTRIAADRASAADFMTTRGGRVFATSADGKFTGHRADIIIIDDLMDVDEARNEARIHELNKKFDTKIETRLNDSTGTIVIVAHRLHDEDLSHHVMQQGGWNRLALEMVAERDRSYRMENGSFDRKKGDLLRRGMFSPKKLRQLRESGGVPEYRLLFQQGRGSRANAKLSRNDFPLFEAEIASTLPVVLSIDTAQKGTGGSSRHAIQVWRTDGRDHYLVEAQSLACNYGNLRASLARLVRKFSPGVVLIEDASSGSMLISELKEEGVANVLGITPRGSKADRLAAHIGTIKKKRVHLLHRAAWLGDWMAEILEFPAGADDQVDALTQFLAFMAGTPEIPQPPPPENKVRGVLCAAPQSGRLLEVQGCVLVRSRSIFDQSW